MSATEATADSTGITNLDVSGNEGGPAPVAIVVSYGFWIFLLSDIIMFSALFATYAVLSGQTAGGPSGRELFDTRNVAIETLCLLFSSYSCGLGSVFFPLVPKIGPLKKWASQRTVPEPARQSFHQWWKARKGSS